MHIDQTIMDQLKDFQLWAQSGGNPEAFTLLDYVGCIATVDKVLAFAELFSPEILVHKGRHFLASGFSQEIYEEWVKAGKGTEDIQRVMNHIHISTLLQDQEVTDEAALKVARVISEIWSKTLSSYGLQVEAIGAGFHDAAVTFFESDEDNPMQHGNRR